MNGLCLAAGLLIAQFGDEITLSWIHSIQKIRWEEDYRREGQALRLVSARVRDSGAGMEPPADAVLREGVWHFTPRLPPLRQLMLTHSPHAPAYQICGTGVCRPVTAWLPGLPDEAVLRLYPCGE